MYANISRIDLCDLNGGRARDMFVRTNKDYSIHILYLSTVRYGTVLQALIIGNTSMEDTEAPTNRVEICGKSRRLLLKFAKDSVVITWYLLLPTATAKSSGYFGGNRCNR